MIEILDDKDIECTFVMEHMKIEQRVSGLRREIDELKKYPSTKRKVARLEREINDLYDYKEQLYRIERFCDLK